MRGRPRKNIQLKTLNVQPKEGIIMLLADDEKVEKIRRVIASIKTTFRGTKYTLPWLCPKRGYFEGLSGQLGLLPQKSKR